MPPLPNQTNNMGTHGDDGHRASRTLDVNELIGSIQSYDENEEEDDVTSVFSQTDRHTVSSATSNDGESDSAETASTESRWIRGSKVLMCFVLFVAAVSSSLVVYQLARIEETNSYKTRFKDVANSLHDVSELNARSIIETYEAAAFQMTSFFQLQNASWPFVSMATFDAQARQMVSFADTNSITFVVLVKEEERTAYEEYVSNHTEWVDVAFKLDGKEDEEKPALPPTIRKPRGGGLIDKANTTGTDAKLLGPIRHVYPNRLARYAYNLDALAGEPTKSMIEYAIELRGTVLSSVNNLDKKIRTELDWPSSFLGVPIFDSIYEDDRDVKAILNANVHWHHFFENVVIEDIDEVYVVISNTCGQEFTYLIDGPNVTYLGNSSLQEERDDGVQQIYEFDALKSLRDCTFKMHVYPSTEFYDTYHTTEPLRSMLTVLGTFLLTAVVFLLYDVLVERRQAYVVRRVQRSDALIDSLFPASVKDRLMINSDTKAQSRFSPLGGSSGDKSSPTKDSDDGAGGKGYIMDPGLDLIASTSKKLMPIADLFLNVTVMFADIVGFTAWSSMREPAQVFSLLETLYSSFDHIAKKLKVFKVETVGDCYVAAAGLPDPTAQHAVIMARFARLCVSKLRVVMRNLAAKLGPDTGDLTMRFGMHSGPVTAGVLRGEKSRFQLFGDTVNTAARIESLGAPDQIHVSQETADALIAAGKKSWIVPRKDRICAKGKGELQTYWIIQKSPDEIPILQALDTAMIYRTKFEHGEVNNVATQHQQTDGFAMDRAEQTAGLFRSVSEGAPTTGAGIGTEKHTDQLQRQRQQHPKQASFSIASPSRQPSNVSQLEVQWNADVLKGMIKRILAMRTKHQLKDLHTGRSQHSDIKLPQRQGTALDEVQEVIKLPSQALPYQQDPSAIELSPAVRSQVDHFVLTISHMYRSNPFHSFSHASHVVQSTVKLLSRIVRREAIDYDGMCYKESNGDALHKFTFGITSDPITQFACVVAALIHDVDHVGLPNSQLVKEEAEIAHKYKNKSVAEQNSFDIAWNLLMTPQYREMRECIYSTKQELMRFRQLLVNAVLATDIMDKELGSLRKARWAKAFDTPMAHHQRLDHSGSIQRDSTTGSDSEEDANRMATIVIEHLIQASDVSHTMQHWHVYQKWNQKLFHEMYLAYKAGRAEKDPSLGWYEGELGFFDFYIIPLAKKLKDCGVFGVSSDEYLNYAQANRKEWAARGKDAVARYMQTYCQDDTDATEN